MLKYDDFAMPSLENIENMAKCYADMERNNSLSKDAKNKENCADNEFVQRKNDKEYGRQLELREDFKILNEIYENIYQSYNIIYNLYKMYGKNRKFYILSENLAKIKLDYESDFIDYNLKLQNKKYSFAESTVAYDLIKIWCKICKLILNNLKEEMLKNKYLTYFIDLIAEMSKY